ncbi:hypothetical protein [Chitinophaga sp. Cy-1792]|uniref:hypothetical protein n=1 Tax=Chitinophaga sp. Cy-1792 TaxID=2608339 RepID=UPI00141F0253|nr:hypothetical protein [Chitinophaga sp. Cy-1792]NIG56301.1 hypothetical protein [Chitinophaga sp. Cy-1792]
MTTHYVAGFFAGMFLANTVPHFVHGISGNPFPTPFSKPRGIGLSSPVVNVVWSLINLVVGYMLLQHARLSDDNPLSLIVFFAGIAFISIYCSIRFQQKHKD